MNVKLCSHSLMIACFWLLPLSAAAQVHAQAQQYPSKSVTIISDSAAGSTPDAVLRVIADRLSQSWGQQVLAVIIPVPPAASLRELQPTLRPMDTRCICRSCPPLCRCQEQRPICQSSCRVTLPRSGSRPKIPCSLSSLPRLASKTSPISLPERKGVQMKYLVLSRASAGSRI